jgi:hypothetical protein
MTSTLDALSQQMADGTAPASATLAELYAEQLNELERADAPLADRVRVIRQVLSAASGSAMPIDYQGRITA